MKSDIRASARMDKQVMAVKVTHRIAILRMAGSERDDRADKAVRPRQSKRRKEIESRLAETAAELKDLG